MRRSRRRMMADGEPVAILVSSSEGAFASGAYLQRCRASILAASPGRRLPQHPAAICNVWWRTSRTLRHKWLPRSMPPPVCCTQQRSGRHHGRYDRERVKCRPGIFGRLGCCGQRGLWRRVRCVRSLQPQRRVEVLRSCLRHYRRFLLGMRHAQDEEGEEGEEAEEEEKE